MGSDVCGLRNGASPITQAESGGVALQMFSALRTHLAVPVAKNHPSVKQQGSNRED